MARGFLSSDPQNEAVVYPRGTVGLPPGESSRSLGGWGEYRADPAGTRVEISATIFLRGCRHRTSATKIWKHERPNALRFRPRGTGSASIVYLAARARWSIQF